MVVGSWARDAARMDSDIDIVVLTDEPARARVVHDGHRIVYDPDGILAALSAACR